MILLRLGLYASLSAAFGIAMFACLVLPAGRARDDTTCRRAIAASAAFGLALSLLWLPLLAAQMAGTPVWPLDRDTLGLILAGTSIGAAWLVRCGALLAAIGWWAVRPRSLRVAGMILAVPLAALAWSGHGAAGEGAGGWLHLAADIAHLLASAVWIGGLLGLSWLVMRRNLHADAARVATARQALLRFTPVGQFAVAVLVGSGVVNGWYLVGLEGVPRLAATPYGRLLLAKLAVFLLMLLLAAANRFRLTPGLGGAASAGDLRAAVAALRASLAIETGAAIVVLGLVAWLGTLEPPSALG